MVLVLPLHDLLVAKAFHGVLLGPTVLHLLDQGLGARDPGQSLVLPARFKGVFFFLSAIWNVVQVLALVLVAIQGLIKAALGIHAHLSD